MSVEAANARVMKTVQDLIDSGVLKNQALDINFSARLDLFLWLKTSPIDELVTTIAHQIEANAFRKKRDVSTQEKFLFSIKIILLNLLLLHKNEQGMLLALSKAIGDYTYKNRFNHPLASYRPFMEAYNGLLNLGYIQEYKGFWDKDTGRGKVTRINSEPKLIQKFDALFPQKFIFFVRHPSEEVMRLKNNKKKLIDYKDTVYSDSARSNLRAINQCLSAHWYDLDLTDREFIALRSKIDTRYADDEGNPSLLNLNARNLYRIYNNGGHKDDNQNFAEGGRFYGGWWQGIPSDYRQHITIDQKHTVEVDYSNMHPAMIYALEGLTLPNDAYTIDGVNEAGRSVVKVAYNKLINGKERLAEPDDYNEELMGMDWKQLLVAIEKRHEPIKKYFKTGYGLKLQKLDSNIAESVLLHFCRMNVPCLPIHDSFIIHHALLDELKDVMRKAYSAAMDGFENKLKIDDYFQLFTIRYAEKITLGLVEEQDIEKLLESDSMSEYESRWHEWLKVMDKQSGQL